MGRASFGKKGVAFLKRKDFKLTNLRLERRGFGLSMSRPVMLRLRWSDFQTLGLKTEKLERSDSHRAGLVFKFLGFSHTGLLFEFLDIFRLSLRE